jgi:hypothetical protein
VARVLPKLETWRDPTWRIQGRQRFLSLKEAGWKRGLVTEERDPRRAVSELFAAWAEGLVKESSLPCSSPNLASPGVQPPVQILDPPPIPCVLLNRSRWYAVRCESWRHHWKASLPQNRRMNRYIGHHIREVPALHRLVRTPTTWRPARRHEPSHPNEPGCVVVPQYWEARKGSSQPSRMPQGRHRSSIQRRIAIRNGGENLDARPGQIDF